MKRAAFYADRFENQYGWFVIERVSANVERLVARCKTRAEAREAARALNLEEKRNAP